MQGFNMGRYIPPDSDGLHHHRQRRRPPGSAAPPPTVRFEMPFAVWCATCAQPTLIGQGVRFNAEKRRAGSYHSTPVWSFRMRHGACGGVIEIRTDPANAEYVVVSGARRRDYGSGGGGGDDESLVRTGAGGFVIMTERERAEQRESAFGKLEKTIADRAQLEGARQRICELQDVAARQWDDPYAQNQRLRKAFRQERHERERKAARAEDLKQRMSLGIDLLPETEEDAKRAALVDFGSAASADDDGGVDKALARPLFASGQPGRNDSKKHGDSASAAKGQRKLKSETAASKTRENLVSEIVGNTRASMDPFLCFGGSSSSSRDSTPKGPVRLAGLKRKRVAEEAPDPPPAGPRREETPRALAGPTPLVSYDSDSD